MSDHKLSQVSGVILIVISVLYLQCDNKSTVFTPVGEAQLTNCSHSDCLGESVSGSLTDLMSDPAEVEILVKGSEITITHKNAMFNCCLDHIQVVLTQQKFLLKLTETESVTKPCLCTCPFEVQATIKVPTPGIYTLEIWAYDKLIWSGEVEVGST